MGPAIRHCNICEQRCIYPENGEVHMHVEGQSEWHNPLHWISTPWIPLELDSIGVPEWQNPFHWIPTPWIPLELEYIGVPEWHNPFHWISIPWISDGKDCVTWPSTCNGVCCPNSGYMHSRLLQLFNLWRYFILGQVVSISMLITDTCPVLRVHFLGTKRFGYRQFYNISCTSRQGIRGGCFENDIGFLTLSQYMNVHVAYMRKQILTLASTYVRIRMHIHMFVIKFVIHITHTGRFGV